MSSTDSSHHFEADGGNERLANEGETLKERNRRLLDKERENLRQRKDRVLMQRSKYVNNSNGSQGVEVKDTANVEDTDNETIKDIVENSCKQRSTVRIDRRWEFEILSRMKVKLLNKAE